MTPSNIPLWAVPRRKHIYKPKPKHDVLTRFRFNLFNTPPPGSIHAFSVGWWLNHVKSANSYGFPMVSQWGNCPPSVCVSSQTPKAVVRLIQVRHGGPRHRRGAEGVHGLGPWQAGYEGAPMTRVYCRNMQYIYIYIYIYILYVILYAEFIDR